VEPDDPNKCANFASVTINFASTSPAQTIFTVVVEACTNLANRLGSLSPPIPSATARIIVSDPQWTNYPARFYGLGLP